MILDVDECDSTTSIDSPCLYGATCHNLYGSYECECVVGYTGPRCGRGKKKCTYIFVTPKDTQ